MAALREQLAWLEARPLHGRSVTVTRARPQASGLAARLRELGATVVEAPAIRVEPVAAALPPLDGFDLVCVTSPNGAHELWARLAAAGLDARALAGARLAAIGPGTARALLEHGAARGRRARRGRWPRGWSRRSRTCPCAARCWCAAREGRDVLPDALRARGAEVEVLVLYETVAEPLADADARAVAADYVTFTSASTVRSFLDAAGGSARRPDRLDRPGHVATRSARPGSSRTSRPTPHTPDGLVDGARGRRARG